MRLFGLITGVVLLAGGLPAVAAEGSFDLKIFQGYNFTDRKVVESAGSDISLTYQTRRIGMISYLGAAKIKHFEQEPDAASLSRSEVDGWKDYVAGPSPGYYVIRARRGAEKYYLLHLRSFENQGKAASFWLMHFDWQEIQPGRR